jgi:hypothetical protein
MFQNFMRNKAFDALKNYVLEIVPYILHAATIICPYW